MIFGKNGGSNKKKIVPIGGYSPVPVSHFFLPLSPIPPSLHPSLKTREKHLLQGRREGKDRGGIFM